MTTVLLVLVIIFIASLVRSTLGFGESLVAVPLLLFFLPADVAVPLSVMVSVVIALVILIQDHKQMHFHSAKWLILYAIPGIPLGVLLLLYGNDVAIKVFLGFLIISYSIYSLISKSQRVLKEDHKLWLFICGFLSGIFGGAYGLNGPPLVIYGNLRQWDSKGFRVTLQAYFLVAGIISLLIYGYKGLLTSEVNELFLYALISTVPAIFLGRFLNHKLSSSFYKYVFIGLIIIGSILVTSSLLS